MLNDLRYGLRMLAKSPGFTAVAVVTLALGIGANTAIFSVLEPVVLKPLPYPHPEELVAVSHTAPSANWTDLGLSASMYFIYREQGRTFEDIGLYGEGAVNVIDQKEPERVPTLDVTDGLLPVLGIPPILGREFARADDLPGSPETVMLSYGYWRRKFDGDRSAVGRTIIADGKPREIIGVLPRSFRFLDEPEPALVLPMKLDRAKTFLGGFGLQGIARLKPGVTLAEADADVARMLPIVTRSFPPPPRFSLKMYHETRIVPTLRPLKQRVVGDAGKILWVLMGGIGLVLLIAGANVANLVLVRVEGRRQEFAIRAALGASLRRIAIELLLESLMLSLVAGALGLVFAYGALRVLVTMAPSGLPRLNEIGIDGAVLVFTLGVALVAGLLLGSIPVLRYSGVRLAAALREAGRAHTACRERYRARSALVVVQVALALTLLISSGLMLRTFRVLVRVRPGFTAPDQIQTFKVFIPAAEVSKPDQVVRIEQDILQKLRAIPGVHSAGLSESIPMDGGFSFFLLFVQDRTEAAGQIPPLRRFNFVSPGFLATLGVPLIAGRDLAWTDIDNKVSPAVVSENLAREYWHDPIGALGKRIRAGSRDPWHEIVGVAADVHYDGVNKAPPKSVYWPPLVRHFQGEATLVVRDPAFAIRSPRAGSEAFMHEVRQAVWSLDPDLPLADVHTLGYLCRKSMERTSFMLMMLAVAGGMALLLGMVGLYAMIAYSVSQRTHEIGIRVALGGSREDVLKLVVGEGFKLTLLGIGAGVVGALASTRFLSSLLYGVKPTDPLTFIVVSLLLIAVALLACTIPARRATKVDPMVALRYQ